MVYWVYQCLVTSRNEYPQKQMPLGGRLLRVEKVEVKAATMYQHHNMRNTSNVWHGLIIIFHFLFPFIFGNRGYCNQASL